MTWAGQDISFPLRANREVFTTRRAYRKPQSTWPGLAGFEPASALVEIMNEDGSMARLPELMKIAERFGLKIISIKDLIAYRLQTEIADP